MKLAVIVGGLDSSGRGGILLALDSEYSNDHRLADASRHVGFQIDCIDFDSETVQKPSDVALPAALIFVVDATDSKSLEEGGAARLELQRLIKGHAKTEVCSVAQKKWLSTTVPLLILANTKRASASDAMTAEEVSEKLAALECLQPLAVEVFGCSYATGFEGLEDGMCWLLDELKVSPAFRNFQERYIHEDRHAAAADDAGPSRKPAVPSLRSAYVEACIANSEREKRNIRPFRYSWAALLPQLQRLDEVLTFSIQRLHLWYFEAPFWPGATFFGYKGLLFNLPAVHFLVSNECVILSMLALAVGQCVSCVIKTYFQRPRPPSPNNVPRTIPVRKPVISNSPDTPSFPSGDTMAGACFGGCMYILSGNPWFLLLGPWAAFGRVYWWCHWVFDTLVGMLLGYGSAFFTFAIMGEQHLEWKSIAIALLPYLGWMKLVGSFQKRAHAKNQK